MGSIVIWRILECLEQKKRGGGTEQKDKLLTSDFMVRGKFGAGKKKSK